VSEGRLLRVIVEFFEELGSLAHLVLFQCREAFIALDHASAHRCDLIQNKRAPDITVLH
jgi:hypothetical protein